jgi:ABC-type Na+ efflux pump permease subunit
MSRVLTVASKEVRTYSQDRGDLAFSLLLPIAIFALMYGAFGDESLFHGTAHIVNEDREGAYSALLIERLRETEDLEVDLLSSPEAESKLDSSDVLLVTYIPEDFSARLAARWPARLIFRGYEIMTVWHSLGCRVLADRVLLAWSRTSRCPRLA